LRGRDVEELIGRADDLMYAAKLKGKNAVQYSE
jgi:PleD family two-component response regulator